MADELGLYVEVFPAGGIVWRYRYRVAGQRKKLTLGTYPALTRKNARIKRDEAAQAAAMDKSPARQKQLAKQAAADVSPPWPSSASATSARSWPRTGRT